MDDKMFYCYEKLSENNDLNISEEEYVESVELIEHFIAKYNLEILDPYREDDAYYLGITNFDNISGYIRVCPKYVCVELIKEYSPQLKGREYLYIMNNKFKGCYCNFVYNESMTNVTINNRELIVKGTFAITDFDNNGCVFNDEIIPYTTDDNIEKLNTAYRANIERGKQIYEELLTYDELGIVSINFVDEGFEEGKGKIF